MTCTETTCGEALAATACGRGRGAAFAPARAIRFRYLTDVAVAATFGVPLGDVRAQRRCRADAAFARQVTMYLAHTVLGMNYAAIGRLVRRDRKTVEHACRVVEMRRDNLATDRMIEMLEIVCAEIATGCGAPPRGRP